MRVSDNSGFNIVMLDTTDKKAKGLVGMKPIPPKTLFVFPGIRPGTVFHSRGVLEPFDIAFLDGAGTIIFKKMVTPSNETATAPPGTTVVMEARAGTFLSGSFSRCCS